MSNAVNNERQIVLTDIKAKVDCDILNIFIQDMDFALCTLLGDNDYCFN